jgi:CheY-like chemotaxis protein
MSGAPLNAGILIVDSDPVVRALFAQALGPFGDVQLATNGLDALRLLSSKKYDVILLDLAVPAIDGFVILQMLSNRPGPNAETPVYALTADVSEQARARALREHAAFVLTKPVPIATLKNLIRAALRRDVAPREAPEAEGNTAELPRSRPSRTPAGSGASRSV